MEVRILNDVTQEPVTLAEIKSNSQIDADYSADDDNLVIIAASAREKLEKQLNLSFAPKTIEVQFYGGEISLPYGPVSGITSLHPYNDDTINVVYKTYGFDYPVLSIDGYDCYVIYPVGWLGGERNLYNVIYEAGFTELPKALKRALLIQIDYEIKNQGVANLDISPDAMKYAASYSRNLTIQS